MNKILTAALFAAALAFLSLYLGFGVVVSPDIGMALLVGLVPAVIAVWVILRGKEDTRFLLRVFIAALGLRWITAYWIFSRRQQSFFGGDAITYDAFGDALAQAWMGLIDPNAPWLVNYTSTSRPGWGMYYFVASIYYVIGRNPLAVQFINCAIGAAAAVVVYRIAFRVYPERRVARIAALLVAITPSMVLWSSQVLKDGPIVFCLCMCTLYTLKLRAKIDARTLAVLLLFLLCLFTLRHYAAYIIFVSICGSLLLLGKHVTPLRVAQGGILAILIGLALAYAGAGEVAQDAFDLQRIQDARTWSARVSNSGYGGDVNIADPEEAAGFLPLGLLYVLIAPFPWTVNNLRQVLTLPELLIWWVLIPFLLRGYWFSLRTRMKESFVILVFTLGLTLAYSLYQTNVGTAYRHRAQLYGFFFIFISIGLELRRSAKQNRKAKLSYPGHLTSPVVGPAGTIRRADQPT